MRVQPGVDLHCHIFPPEYLRLARTQGDRIRARIYRRDDGREYIQAPGDFDYPLTDDLWSVGRRTSDLLSDGHMGKESERRKGGGEDDNPAKGSVCPHCP